MKKILSLFVFTVIVSGTVFSQTTYGLKTGINLSGVSNVEDQRINPSFFVSAYSDISISEKFSIQPGISLQGKGYKRVIKNFIQGDNNKQYDYKQVYNYLSIEIPVNVVYYIPVGSDDIFISAGPYLGFNLSGKYKETNLETLDAKLKSSDIKFSGNKKTMNRLDAGVNFAIGYKLTDGFLLQAGYGLGLTNLNPSKTGKSFSNRVFNFGVGFQL